MTKARARWKIIARRVLVWRVECITTSYRHADDIRFHPHRTCFQHFTFSQYNLGYGTCITRGIPWYKYETYSGKYEPAESSGYLNKKKIINPVYRPEPDTHCYP